MITLEKIKYEKCQSFFNFSDSPHSGEVIVKNGGGGDYGDWDGYLKLSFQVGWHIQPPSFSPPRCL